MKSVVNYFVSILVVIFEVFGEDEITTPLVQDEFKCTVPDVTSLDHNLDITRFRSDFSKISEVKFPGLIGPLNERLICKIKCIDGNWVGPLCSSTPDGRFQPILRECLYRNDHPLLTISFKNSSIDNEASFPHGSVITARCKHFGHYKMKGDGTLRCENGEWAPKLPECVPTTAITNFTGDAPPTIQYTVVSGSAGVEPTGELLVYPDSTLWLDCITPRSLGDPDWSWTQALGHLTAGWARDDSVSDTHYRLTLGKMSARHSGQYTCTAPTGHTNTVTVKVVSVICPALNASTPRVRQFAQGSRLGHAAHFSCQSGYHLQGSATLTCMGDGRWSSPPPTCEETRCPQLDALGPHLSVVEFNASWGGRAVFQEMGLHLTACHLMVTMRSKVERAYPEEAYSLWTLRYQNCSYLGTLNPCSWGYRLVGAPGLECQQDGTWSGFAPHCTPVYCPEPAVPAQGRVVEGGTNGRRPVGALALYECDPGLELTGESSIVCTENGFWSHPPPFCIRRTDTILVDNTTLVRADE